MMAAMNAAADILNIESLKPPPAAAKEIISAGMRFEHHPSGESRGSVTLSHPGCPRLTVDYGTRDCFSLDQAIQLILYVYQKEYQFRG